MSKPTTKKVQPTYVIGYFARSIRGIQLHAIHIDQVELCNALNWPNFTNTTIDLDDAAKWTSRQAAQQWKHRRTPTNERLFRVINVAALRVVTDNSLP